MSHKTHPIKTKTFGPKLDHMDMQNNPFRAAAQDGHMLNESYKMPTPNALGENLSYHHPLGSKKTQSRGNKMPLGPMRDTKNTF